MFRKIAVPVVNRSHRKEEVPMSGQQILIKGLAWLGLGTFAVVAMGQATPPAPFITHQLKPDVYWIEGGGGNSTVIIGKNGVVIVDAKTTEAGGHELLEDIAK